MRKTNMDEKDSEKKPHQKKRNSFLCWGIMLIGSVAVFISVSYFPFFLKKYTHAQSVVGLGEYGDIYGGLNTLFTGLAFVGLVVTILLQRQEMRETREEFEEQTKQFEEQTRLLNEQIEEQKRANEKQFQLALASQYKEELFKRLELIKKIENEITIEPRDVSFDGFKWESYKTETKQGEDALITLFFCYSDFFAAINSTAELKNITKRRMSVRQADMYVSLNKLNSWLLSISDYLRDVPTYFSKTPDVVGVYYRMMFNSLSKNGEAIMLMHAGTTIPNEYIQAAIDKKYTLRGTVMPIHVDNYARLLLFQYVNKDLSLEKARILWKKYLDESGKKFETYALD